MKFLILFLAFAGSSFAQLVYPVDVVADRFTVLKDGVLVKRGAIWPTADGMQIPDLAVDVTILKEVIAPIPTPNPATHKLGPGEWAHDIPNQTATFSRPVVALTTEELAEIEGNNDRQTKATNLSASIATLRTWSTEAAGTTVTAGNVVAVTQTMVNRLGIFFSRFADLLEVQRIGE